MELLGSTDNGVPVMQTPDARRRRIVMPLLVAVVVGIVVLLLARGGQQTQLIGSGSTLAQPLIERSIADFRNSVAADRADRPSGTGSDWMLDGSGIAYEPVGSLGGVIRLSDPEVDFAVTDYPLSQAALTERELAQFPIALGAIGVVHNLVLPEGKALRLDGPTLAGIYLGQVTRWNDPALQALNPGLDLPDQRLTPVHRTDGSGSTLGFTSYLGRSSRKWAPGVATEITWPTGVGAERSSGLISAVAATEGSLGYAEQGQAIRAGLALAELENAAGRYTRPSPQAMQAAIPEDWSGDQDFALPLTPGADIEAYPLTVAIYAVVKRNPQFEGDTSNTLRYLAFLIETYDGAGTDLGYLPLPTATADAVRAYWARVLGFSA